MKNSTYRSTLPEKFSDDFAQKTIKDDMFLADTFHTISQLPPVKPEA